MTAIPRRALAKQMSRSCSTGAQAKEILLLLFNDYTFGHEEHNACTRHYMIMFFLLYIRIDRNSIDIFNVTHTWFGLCDTNNNKNFACITVTDCGFIEVLYYNTDCSIISPRAIVVR